MRAEGGAAPVRCPDAARGSPSARAGAGAARAAIAAASAATSSGRQPCLLASSSMLTWISTFSGAALGGPVPRPARRPASRRSTVCTQSNALPRRRGLVRLQVADQVPLQRQRPASSRLLGQRFLHVVLAEGALARRRPAPRRPRRLGLGHRQQPRRWPAGLPSRVFNALQDSVQGVVSTSSQPRDRCGIAVDTAGSGAILPAGGAGTSRSTLHVNRSAGEHAMDIAELLAFSVKNKASDLHLSAGLPPMIRVDGDVRRINIPALDHKQVHALVYDIMSDKQRRDYEEFLEVDFSFEIPGLARFRVNAFNQNRGAGAVFRTIPVRSADARGPRLPAHLQGTDRPAAGPDPGHRPDRLGQVDHAGGDDRPRQQERIRRTSSPVEDPIEFVHTSQKCLINQREVHRDTHGFNEALRSALREDPDYILVGEMRDLETIRLALTAAETGHLVFATLHTSSAAKTIDRIIDVFPAGEKPMVRSMLSESLRAVISQALLKKVGGGRTAAWEIMVGIPAIRNLIREDKVAQMYSAIQTGQNARHDDPRPAPAGPGQARPGHRARRPRNTPRTSGCSSDRSTGCRPPTSPTSISETRHEQHRLHLVPQADGAPEGVGPVHHRRHAAVDEGQRQDLADHAEPADAAAEPRPRAERDDAAAARGVREDPRVQLRDRRRPASAASACRASTSATRSAWCCAGSRPRSRPSRS